MLQPKQKLITLVNKNNFLLLSCQKKKNSFWKTLIKRSFNSSDQVFPLLT